MIAVPGYRVSFVLPAGWAWVTYRDPPSMIKRFAHKHPVFEASPNLSARESSPVLNKVVGSSPDSRSDFALSITRSGPVTLRHDIALNLAALGQAGATIHGRANQIVDISGLQAWRVWWSIAGWQSTGAPSVGGTLQVVQYTFIRGGRIYLFSYRTLGSAETVTTAFDPVAGLIRFRR